MSEIQYCRNQVIFIILEFLDVDGNEIVLLRDTWPLKATGYTQAEKTGLTSVSSHAPYEAVIGVVGEVQARLKATGLAGKNLVLHLRQGTKPGDEAYWALGYVCGWKRKHLPFARWVEQKRRRNEAKKASVK